MEDSLMASPSTSCPRSASRCGRNPRPYFTRPTSSSVKSRRGIRDAVERIRPRRAVFDSLGALRILTGSPHRFQAEILSLCQLLMRGDGCTTLFLSDPADVSQDNDLQSLASGVVHLQQSPPRYGEVRRLLRVVKLRGVPHSGGYHNFSIRTGGLEVYPRLTGYGHPEYQDFKPVRSGIERWTGCSAAGWNKGRPACSSARPAPARVHWQAFTSDTAAPTATPPPFSCSRKGQKRSWRLCRRGHRPQAVRGHGKDPHPATGHRDAVSRTVFTAGARGGANQWGQGTVVLDSLTGYFNAMAEEGMLVEQMHDLLSYLSRQGVLTILVITQEGLASVGTSNTVDISYLSDTIVVLRQFEAEGTIRCVASRRSRSGKASTRQRSGS